jgi:hypothetical protein
MTAPDHLGAALYFAARARRTRDGGERARLIAVAAKYREMVIAEAVAFMREMPKGPAAASVRRPAARRKRA